MRGNNTTALAIGLGIVLALVVLFSGALNGIFYFIVSGTIPGLSLSVSATTMFILCAALLAFTVVKIGSTVHRAYKDARKHRLYLPKRRYGKSTPATQNN